MSNFSNTAKTMYLTAAITNVSTTVTVTNTPGGSVVNPSGYGWPSVPFYAEIDGDSLSHEVVKVVNNASGTLTVVRPTGQSWAYGSTALSHNMNAPIVPVLSAADVSGLLTQSYVNSKAMNLVTNGTGYTEDNTNFSGATFDQSDVSSGSGAFAVTAADYQLYTDEYITVDTSKTYRLKFDVKQYGTPGGLMYSAIGCFDIDKNIIYPYHFMFQANTHTILAADLKPGDTTVYLANAANWNNSAGASTHLRNIIVWGYTNSKGYTYPDYTYSRKVVLNAYADGGINYGANTITLSAPWPSTWGTIPAGTSISNGSSSSTHNYLAAPYNVNVPTSWTTYYGEIGGMSGGDGLLKTYRFRPGTAFVRPLFNVNRGGVTGSAMKLANISFTEVSSGQIRSFEKFDTYTSGVDWFNVKNSGGTPVFSVDLANNRIGINKSNPSYALDVIGSALFSGTITVGSDPSGDYEVATKHYVDTVGGGGGGSPLDPDLTAIANLTGTSGYLKKTAANTWALDTSTFLTSGQTLTLNGDVSASGAITSPIAVTVADNSHNHTSSTISGLDASDISTGVFAFSQMPTGTTSSTVAIGNHTHASLYQPLDADLTAIAGLSTTGYLRRTGTNTWILDATTAGTVWGEITGTLADQTDLNSALSGKQAADADLSAIAALAGTSGFLKKTAANTWTLDTNTYITSNQTITLTGVVTGSGTTSITTSFASSPTFTGTVTATTFSGSGASLTSIPQSAVTNLTTDLGNKQQLDADLTSIAGLAGTSGLLRKTAADTWTLDTSTYLTANQTITLSGDASGSGTTAITVTVADDSHAHTGSTISALDAGDTTTGTFDIARIPTGTTGTTVALGNHTHSYQPLDNDLTAIAALTGTGFLQRTGVDTWALGSAGDVVGPSSVVDNAIAVFDSTTGKLIKSGGMTLIGSGSAPLISYGSGSPAWSNLNISAPVGSIHFSTYATGGYDHGLWFKDSGTDETGWLPIARVDTNLMSSYGEIAIFSPFEGGGQIEARGLRYEVDGVNHLYELYNTSDPYPLRINYPYDTGEGWGDHGEIWTGPLTVASSDSLKHNRITVYDNPSEDGGSVVFNVDEYGNIDGQSLSSSGALYLNSAWGISSDHHIEIWTPNSTDWYARGIYAESVTWQIDQYGSFNTNGGLMIGDYQSGTKVITGTGTPESSVTANPGSLYLDKTTGAGTAYIKNSGTGNTGWTALGTGSGSGDVVGPASSTDNAIVRFDSTTGKLIQNSGVTINDSNKLLTIASGTSSAGLNLPHGSAPTSPANGDVWTTSSGVYARVNGVTVGPFEAAAGSYQPASADLSAIDALAGTSGFLKKTATDTWALDTNTYLTGNQSITVSGDASGSGTTSIALTLANSGVTAGTYNNNAAQVRPFTVDAKGRVTSIGTAVSIAIAQSAVTNLVTDLGNKQPLDADLTAIAALAGTSGFLKKTAADTWALDTNTYLTGNQSITLSGVVTGSGTTSITTAFASNPSFTGTVTATTFSGALSGNASTATSAATWTTARTLTIGSTGKSVNGSANVSWSLNEIGAQPVDADLTAIAALAGTSGLLKKTAADTWTLDTTAYTTNTGTVTSVAMTVPTGLSISGTPITASGTLALTLTAGYSIPTTASQSNWDTAYTDRNKWDGGSTGLTASTGRTSLGGTTVGQNLFTLTNPSAITFLQVNANNTVSALSASAFRTAIGAGTSSTVGTVTSVAMTVPTGLSISGTPITSSGTLALSLTAGYSIPTTASQSNWDTAYTDRNKWDGGSTGLTASTGRASLGGTTVGQNLFTLANPSAITFLRVNADNTVSALDAASFKSAIGAGSGTGDVVGPASSTDNAIVRFDSTTGKLVQDSNIIIEDTGHLITPANITLTRQWPIIAIDGVNGKHGAIIFQSDASNRWDIGPTDDSAQDLKIVRRDDSGTWLDQPMTIRRSDGQTTFRSTITDGLVARGATHGSVVALGEAGDAISWLQAESASGNYAYSKLRTRWGQAGQNELHTGLSYDGSWFVSPKIVNGSSVSRDNTIHIASDGTITFNPASGYVNINGINMHLRNQNSAADIEVRADYSSVYQVYKPSYNSGTGVTWIEFWKGSQRYWGNNATSTDFKWDYYNGSGFTDFLYISRTTNPGRIQLGVPAQGIEYGSSGPRDLSGSGTPESNVSAPVGSTYRRTDTGIGTSLYVKESGTGSTGWVPHQRIITGSGTTGASGLSVSFGVTYTSAPQVMATLKAYTANAQLLVSSITTTGCTVVAYNISNGSNLSGVSVGWVAIG